MYALKAVITPGDGGRYSTVAREDEDGLVVIETVWFPDDPKESSQIVGVEHYVLNGIAQHHIREHERTASTDWYIMYRDTTGDIRTATIKAGDTVTDALDAFFTKHPYVTHSQITSIEQL